MTDDNARGSSAAPGGSGGAMTLSSPPRLVCNYFEALRRRVAALPEGVADGETKQDITVCVMLAVAAVEVFLNLFFRVVVGEDEFHRYERRVLKELKGRCSLEYKLREWPQRIFGKRLDQRATRVAPFYALKERRNALMHFTSSHETVQWPEQVDGQPRALVVHGLADTRVFDSLERQDAAGAVEAAEDLLSEIFTLRGIPERALPTALHLWTGKVPGDGPTARLSFSVPVGPVSRL